MSLGKRELGSGYGCGYGYKRNRLPIMPNFDMWAAQPGVPRTHGGVTKVYRALVTEFAKRHFLQQPNSDIMERKSQVQGSRCDWNFNEMTKAGRMLADQNLGLYLGCPDDFDLFGDYLYPLINRYHGVDMAVRRSLKKPDWNRNLAVDFTAAESARVKSTRFRTARNFANWPFTCNMTLETRLKLEEIMVGVFYSESGIFEGGTYYSWWSMGEQTRYYLNKQKHLLFPAPDETLLLIGTASDFDHGKQLDGKFPRGIPRDNYSQYIGKDKSNGRGIFVSKDESFAVWVGEEDALRIISMGKALDEVWEVFRQGISGVQTGLAKKNITFSYDDKLGYLSSCPSNIGTGLRASVHLEVPGFGEGGVAYTNLNNFLKQNCLNNDIQIRSMGGESGAKKGCVWDISNLKRFSDDTQSLIEGMVTAVKLIVAEDNRRSGF